MKIILLFGLLTIVNLVQAQQTKSHEFSINAGAGTSALQYKPIFGTTNAELRERFGIGYTYFFSPQWGITTGLDLGYYNAKIDVNKMDLDYLIPTPQGLTDNFHLYASYSNYTENQKASFLQLPVMLQMQTPVQRNFFYIAAGLKFGFALSGTYDSSAETLKTVGYSNYTGQYYEDMPKYGFDTYKNIKASGDLNFDMAYLLALETGMKWTLSGKTSLYTGVFLDYGLNNVNGLADRNLLVYNSSSPKNYQYNSILQSSQGGKSMVDKVVPFSVGVKIKLGLGFGSEVTSKAKERLKSLYIVNQSYINEKASQTERKLNDEEAKEAELKAAELREERAKAEEAKVEVKKVEAVKEVKTEKAKVVVAEESAKSRLTPTQRTIIERPVGGYRLREVELNASQKTLMVYRITVLMSYPTIPITIEGHAFDSESSSENFKLGKARADKMKEYLVNKGIAAERIKTVSKGDTVPLAPGSDNNSTNRRIQIIVQ
ncbi:hypothetical protein FACS189415_3070 [Bacteroidia bacterium]|nr:hypothetical protein FACS189415_3070 [Bacteroidia bacterium]